MKSVPAILVAVFVGGLNGYAETHRQAWGDWLSATLFLVYAMYCVQNFVRCREVHCAITGPGFFVATIVMALKIAGATHYSINVPWAIFAGTACLGYCVQWAYQAKTGSAFLNFRS